MLDNLKNDVRNHILPLLSGIVDDTQKLFRQEVALAKCEVKQEVKVVKEAGMYFGIGLALGSLAVLLSCLTLVHLLGWLFPTIPLWADYAIVTLMLGIPAGVFLMNGKTVLDKGELMPRRTIETMKENAEWAKGQAAQLA